MTFQGQGNRRGGDSNPRYGFDPVRRFSKPLPDSVTAETTSTYNASQYDDSNSVSSCDGKPTRGKRDKGKPATATTTTAATSAPAQPATAEPPELAGVEIDAELAKLLRVWHRIPTHAKQALLDLAMSAARAG